MNDVAKYELKTIPGKYVSIPVTVLNQSENIFRSRESVARASDDESMPTHVLEMLSEGYIPETVGQSAMKDAVTLSLALADALDRKNCEEARTMYAELKPVLDSYYSNIATNVEHSMNSGPC